MRWSLLRALALALRVPGSQYSPSTSSSLRTAAMVVMWPILYYRFFSFLKWKERPTSLTEWIQLQFNLFFCQMFLIMLQFRAEETRPRRVRVSDLVSSRCARVCVWEFACVSDGSASLWGSSWNVVPLFSPLFFSLCMWGQKPSPMLSSH